MSGIMNAVSGQSVAWVAAAVSGSSENGQYASAAPSKLCRGGWKVATCPQNCAAPDHGAASPFQSRCTSGPQIEAALPALREPWSNGQTEGQINRLKALKRQMYGRANIDLLWAQLIAPA